MSSIADDAGRIVEPDDPIQERTCPKCRVSYRVSAADLAAHVATCAGR